MSSPSLSASQDVPLGLPGSLFWDVNPAEMDADRSAPLILSRVVELGTLEDWLKVRRHYGDERMIGVLTGLRCLSKQAVAFCCAVFDLDQEDFRCSTTKQSRRAPWIC